MPRHELLNRRWRLEASLRRTLERRPDLLTGRPMNPEERRMLEAIAAEPGAEAGPGPGPEPEPGPGPEPEPGPTEG